MSFVVDTNVLSELRKGKARCDARLWKWYEETPVENIYISVIVLGEIRRGIEMKRPHDPATAGVFERWLKELVLIHRGRVVGVTYEISDLWGRVMAVGGISMIDAMIAATAAHYGYTIVTRNTRDFQRCGVDFFNPFEA